MEAARASLKAQNLARASAGRDSWAEEFALAQRCRDKSSALANPHGWQRLELPPGAFPELDRMPLQRELLPSAPRRTYHRREGEVKSAVHWGQRKLLMAELEFLAEFGNEADLIVYAGAAPGTHLASLCKLFPGLTFEAYDPRPFFERLQPPAGPRNLHLHQEVFTDDHARTLAGRGVPLLFVSDIRTADWLAQGQEEHDEALLADLEAQRHWVQMMSPKRSLLKFRLPYTNGQTEYLAGEVRLPVWGPQTTTECRLLVSAEPGKPLATRVYDHHTWSEQLFYFNTVARVSIYPRPSSLAGSSEEADTVFLQAGLDRCYDCSREVQIIHDFLVSRGKGPVTAQDIVEMAQDFSVACGRGRDGLLVAPAAPWQADMLRAAKARKC